MAHRLDACVIQGEISNTHKNSVTGRLHVLRTVHAHGRTIVKPAVLILSLTGNLSPQLAGRTLHFQLRPQQLANPPKPLPDFFHSEQIGILSDSVLKIIPTPSPVAEDDAPTTPVSAAAATTAPENRRNSLPPLATPAPRHHSSLYLEWASQNGTVALELLDPIVQLHDSPSRLTPLPDETTLEITPDLPDDPDANHLGHPGQHNPIEQHESDNPYQLFDPQLEEQIRNSTLPHHSSWNDILPTLDPQTKRLCETWDEVLGGKKDEPLTTLFDQPLQLPKPHSIHSDKQAWDVLSQLLRAMALRGVAFDMCPHFSALQAYQLLVEELLPNASVHPELVNSGFICHFNSAEFCPHCHAKPEPLA
jgi:hypothetical protein